MRPHVPFLTSRRSPPALSQAGGFTMVEVLMSFTILAVGVLGFIGAFMTVSQSIQGAKTRAVATSLLQEKVEALKNISYYRLVPTTAPIPSTEPGFTEFQYDPFVYPSETMVVGDIRYTRRVYVEKVNSTGAGVPAALTYQTPDSGLKRVKVYVIWQVEGGDYKMLEMQNLLNNPNRQFLGGLVNGSTVNSGGTNLTGVTIMTVENAAQFDQTASGAYSFSAAPGVYTLQASKPGYFPVTLSNVTVVDGGTTTWNPALTLMSKGTVEGMAYMRNHLVISQVVGRHDYAGFKQEWVEVYNPTTWTWTTADLGLRFQRVTTIDAAPVDIYLDAPVVGATTLPPSKFLLFANTTTITVAAYPGFPVTASVLWNKTAGTNDVAFPGRFTAADPNVITTYNDTNQWGAGGVQLYRVSDGAVQDTVGWKGNGASTIPPLKEGNAFDDNQGLNDNQQFYRLSSVSGYNPANGPAYDTHDSEADWERYSNLNVTGWIPKSHVSGAAAPITGTPAAGAYASADDGLSDVVLVGATGYFAITSVATGTWNVGISSASCFVEFSTTVASNGQVVNAGNFGVTGSTTAGFITGMVMAANGAPLNGISVQEAGGASGTSGLNGRYKIVASTGLTSATANPNNSSSLSYVSDTISGLNVVEGAYLNGVDFRLDTGGRITGRIQIGANPLPGVPVTATSATVTAAETVSDANGYFTLRNLSTATYTVVPQLESGETYSVSGSSSVNIPGAGQLVWSATFTVTNAFGWVTGGLTASGQPIKTGVLIFATTSTLASGAYPPNLTDTVRNGSNVYYSASSLTDGTYEVAVPGGNVGSPITYNIYGWYTTWNGSTPTVVRRETTAAVTGGGTVTGRNLSW